MSDKKYENAEDMKNSDSTEEFAYVTWANDNDKADADGA